MKESNIKSTNVLENDLFKFETIYDNEELIEVNLYIKHYELLGEQSHEDIIKLGYNPLDFDIDEVVYKWDEPILKSDTCENVLELTFEGDLEKIKSELYNLFRFGD